MSRARLDLVALLAAVLAMAMAGGYVWVLAKEADRPAVWFLAALVFGAASAGYGAAIALPYRRAAVLLAGLLLLALGAMAILSIGLPIVVAGALCLIAAARSKPLAPRHGTMP